MCGCIYQESHKIFSPTLFDKEPEIDAQLRKYGYTGTLSGVRVAIESIRKERKRQGIKESSVRISRRQMISYVWKRKSRLLEKELQLLEQSFKMYPSLHSFHQMVQTFREAFDERNYPAFFKWLEKQLSSPNNHLYDCALRLRRDLQSIKLAFSTSYSNGVVEGHVHRLKLMKRIMYGRAKLDLLCFWQLKNA
ncbi:transposase [Ureibacillus terrenus]|uniref:transposase n=1 Tax=Ureibacillus terrenus TaxID=118246 RepID=UPI002E232D12|nr:transposase [Ureibacillus terrenus]MED3763928.1 transposase [Ureibacillus terrenus]